MLKRTVPYYFFLRGLKPLLSFLTRTQKRGMREWIGQMQITILWLTEYETRHYLIAISSGDHGFAIVNLVWASFCVWVLVITDDYSQDDSKNFKDLNLVTLYKDSMFKICLLLFWTHNRFYISQSGLEETRKA